MSAESSGSFRYFSGDNEDAREYKRWKVWAMNKMITMDKLGEAARGPFIYTLLSGKALEAVEHVKPEEYQTKGGDQVLWKLLDARFPQQEASDELSEIMGEVFGLRAKDGESMKQWTARATELFDRCYRKTGVQFPEESRGWIMLNRAGLSDEQRAVVISRARGDLKRESVAIALRSCYPDLTVSRKKAIAMVEDEALVVEDPELDEVEDFKDVDLLLEDHHLMTDGDGPEVFQESDVAEVLATSWRDKRRELNQLQKSRQFGKAREVKRAYRIEVEELKRQTACHKCGKKGHWARECRSTSAKGSSKGSKAGAAAGDSASSGAALVETPPDFVAAVQPTLKLIDLMRQHNQKSDSGEVTPVEVNLVSSPGFGVLDSGCGRTIIGSVIHWRNSRSFGCSVEFRVLSALPRRINFALGMERSRPATPEWLCLCPLPLTEGSAVRQLYRDQPRC